MSKRTFDSHFHRSNQAYLKNESGTRTEPIRIGFVLLEHFSMMAFTGAVDAIVTANLLSSCPLYTFQTLSTDGDAVRSDLGIDISVNAALLELDIRRFDLLFLCGGYRTPLQPDRQLLEKLREADRLGLTLGGLWNGSLMLAQAGLMNGYECTLHPENRASLEETCPKVRLSTHPYVIDRHRVSCAGASSALDMMLAVIRQHYGQEVVRGIEEILSCDKIGELPDRPMPTVASDPTLPESLKAVLQLMEANIEEPLGMEEIAGLVNLSRRQIERLFHRHIESTPSKYYLELRITRARRLLLQTNESIAAIAVACGFVSTTHFSHCYRDYFGVSPTQARQNRAKSR
ncbi:GlxA family transcriptional regulator [Marinobacterium aestuariivivens]|uniref:GlxA family transcriptional regulator n=1 Tax=Marinobacterium aestuariivivens TaxID=1698799 RepID=A0ABW1ZXN2_9GAMM